MFCVKGHEFDIDPNWAHLSAFIDADSAVGLLRTCWSLEIHAIPRTIIVPAVGDQSPVKLAPRVQLDCLQFTVSAWRALTGVHHTFSDDIRGGWLLCSEWESFTHLKLAFGLVRDRSITVELDGIGLHESWPQLLGSEVPFNMSASVLFTGVGLYTPPNVTDPTAHALSRLRHNLPDYRFEPPKIEELRHEAGYYGCHVLFPPTPSA